MTHTSESLLLDVLLDSWDRNNTILLNLLRAIPTDALGISAGDGSPTVAGMFAHLHYVRLVFVSENAPSNATPLPADEWTGTSDPDQLAAMLTASAAVVRQAVRHKLETGTPMDLHFDHPILFLQHMIWHEGYHHGQMKLTLKLAGRALDDRTLGRATWGTWMDKH